MAWTSLTYAYGSVLTSTKMTQNQDNFAAMAAGLSGAPSITVVGDATGVTQAVGDNSTKVATTAFCEAGFVNNDVGVEGVGMLASVVMISGTCASGATVAGSSIKHYGVAITSGTWRNVNNYTATTTVETVFQRIS